MTIETDLKGILQPYATNLAEYAAAVNENVRETFSNRPPYTMTASEYLTYLKSQSKVLSELRKAFDHKHAAIRFGTLNVEYWKFHDPISENLWDNMYIGSIGNLDDWNISLKYNHEFIDSEVMIFSLLPGAVLFDEQRMYLELRRPIVELRRFEESLYETHTRLGRYAHTTDSLSGRFTLKKNPGIYIETKRINGVDGTPAIDSAEFKISQLGSGALDEVLTLFGVQK